MTHINLRRDTASNWTTTNPVLQLGEAGWEKDTGKIKFGDGVTAWTGLGYLPGTVVSVAGKTGIVTLTQNDVGLSNVNNTADAAKPVSTATQNALNLKADLASPTFTGTPQAPTTSTSDNSTKLATTQYVQNQKTSPVFTGTPQAPTAVAGTNTTQLATTAFIQAALAAAIAKSGSGQSGSFQIGSGSGALLVQWGSTAIGSIAANSTTNATTTFPTAYASAPLVIPAFLGSSSVTVGLSTPSTTAVTYTCRNSSASTVSASNVYWIALGFI